MMGVTSVLLLLRDARNKAQAKRTFNQLKTIIENGKEQTEKREAEETERSGDHNDRHKSTHATP
jgi:hypothetical protein